VLEVLGADLMAQIPRGERYAVAARGWLDGVLAEVFPDLLEGLRTRSARKAGTGPGGKPGQLLGQIWLGVTDPVPRRPVKFSDAGRRRMLDSLAGSPLAVMI
jgi:hypothetical protein